jgi:RNA polymerase sigma-70 factor, ECF subfamily
VNHPAEAWSETDFERLFRAHFDEIYRVLFRVVGSKTEAEDLAQEVFLRCYRQGNPGSHGDPGSPDDPGSQADPAGRSLRPWLYRVALNLAFNARRDRRRLDVRHEKAGRIGAATGDRPDTDPVESISREEDRAAVRRILAGLPPRQAQILLLRHAGLSYREVAATIDVSPTSIGALLARAETAFESAYRAAHADRNRGPDAMEASS